MNKKALLEWQMEAGADEAVGDAPVNRLGNQGSGIRNRKENTVAVIADTRSPIPDSRSPSAACAEARRIADACQTLEALKEAIASFDGCAIKKTASKTVISDGNPKARVMIIGEAPGAQEDIQGIPFCGPSGMLLDKMLAAIGLDRKASVYISNTVFWRPPGNRQPTPEETAICLPLVEKHIALVNPALLICSGGVATTTLLARDQSMSRLRGRFYDYANPYLKRPIPAAVMYHPSYLLRSPLQKRLAWSDLLMIRRFLAENGVTN